MRGLFTTQEALARGLTESGLRWGVRSGRWRRVLRGVYAEGPEDPTLFDRAVATVLVTGGVASGGLAGVLHRLDAVGLSDGFWATVTPDRRTRHRRVRESELDPAEVVTVDGIPCTDGARTLLDLAASLDDLRCEQALESALRRRLSTVGDLDALAAGAGPRGQRGIARLRRVLALRPEGAPPTESLLETHMLQLARRVGGLGEPRRQFEVYRGSGDLVARLDLAWPELGLFVELDGQHHAGQPCYDSRRETAIVAATGWLCGRFTWTEVVKLPTTTVRRMGELVHQAGRRRFDVAKPT